MQRTCILKPKFTAASPKRAATISKTSCLIKINFKSAGGGSLITPHQRLLLKSSNPQGLLHALPKGDGSSSSSSNENPPASSANNNNNNNDNSNTYDPTSYSKGPSSVAIPVGLRSAGAVFILAGFLKILILCFPFSSMAISMFIQGKADLGAWAAVKMIPIALGILALAKVLVDRKIHERKWFHRTIVAASVVALFLSRWLFARTRPSPLDPLLAAHQREVVAAVAEARKQQAANAMAQQRGRYLEPSQQAKQEVEKRPRGRFS